MDIDSQAMDRGRELGNERVSGQEFGVMDPFGSVSEREMNPPRNPTRTFSNLKLSSSQAGKSPNNPR